MIQVKVGIPDKTSRSEEGQLEETMGSGEGTSTSALKDDQEAYSLIEEAIRADSRTIGYEDWGFDPYHKEVGEHETAIPEALEEDQGPMGAD